MKLEELVPPIDLCKLIPKGEFEDSAFIWDKTTSVGFWDGEDKDGNHIGGFGKIPHKKYRLRQNYSDRCRKHLKDQDIQLDIFPAPTLEEILQELFFISHGFDLACFWDGGWHVKTNEGEKFSGISPVCGALKLWLELKGIEA